MQFSRFSAILLGVAIGGCDSSTSKQAAVFVGSYELNFGRVPFSEELSLKLESTGVYEATDSVFTSLVDPTGKVHVMSTSLESGRWRIVGGDVVLEPTNNKGDPPVYALEFPRRLHVAPSAGARLVLQGEDGIQLTKVQ
jgi:hypothetical protein